MFLKRFRFSTAQPYLVEFTEPWLRFSCFADGDGGEGEGEGGSGTAAAAGGEGEGAAAAGDGEGKDAAATASATPDWLSDVKDANLKTALTGYASEDAFLTALGIDPAAAGEGDWREGLPDDLKQHADRFTSIEDVIKGNLDLRKQLSGAIVPPGKDAKPEEVAAYLKKIGVPETADGYKFEVPEGHELTDEDKAFQTETGKLFHELKINAEQAKGLNIFWNELQAKGQEAQVAADKKFADDAEAVLRQAWPGKEYDQNMEFANRAAARLFGSDLEEAKHMEVHGRFLLDHPIIAKAFAGVGREMAEAGLVPKLSEADSAAVDQQLTDLRARIAKAQADGNGREANRLYQEEQALIAKSRGNQNIVGAGRAA